jgi:hypothetical protein
MRTYVILRRSGWETRDELAKTASRSARVGLEEMADRVQWIRSYVLEQEDGRLGTLCIYEATDPDALREHARRAGMPADEIYSVQETVVLRDDPDRAP